MITDQIFSFEKGRFDSGIAYVDDQIFHLACKLGIIERETFPRPKIIFDLTPRLTIFNPCTQLTTI